MSSPSSRLARFRERFGGWITALKYVAAWIFLFDGISPIAQAWTRLFRTYSLFGGARDAALYYALTNHVPRVLTVCFGASLIFASVAAVLVAVLKRIRETRFQWSGVDLLSALSQWSRAHRKLGIALSYVPGSLLLWAIDALSIRWNDASLVNLGAAVVASVAMSLTVRSVLKPLAAPPVKRSEPMRIGQLGDDLFFRAVAVTAETKAAVWAMAGLASLAVAFGLRDTRGSGDDSSIIGIGVVACIAALGTAVFLRASRIAIGLDGVLITGTSRTRFYSYKSFDSVSGSPIGEVVLERQGRMLVRLQLHGKDAPRRDAIITRIVKGLERSRELMSGGASRLADARKQARLDAAARGGQGDYRAVGASRDEVWEVLEASATLPDVRVKAAEALKIGSDDADIQRLRVAAEHCAEPAARKAILRVVSDLDEAAQEAEREARSEADLAPSNRHLDIKPPTRS